jgi:putative salt-induced outer membrane protein YdiY
MMKRFFSRLLLPLLLFSLVLQAVANEAVMLRNGDRVSGKIVEESEEAVTIETEFAGKITIARKHIAAIGESKSVSVEKVALAATNKTLAKVEAKPASKPGAVKPPARLFGGRHMGVADGWEGNANVGFSYTSGNSNYTTMSTGLRAVKTGGRDNLTVYARSLWYSNRNSGRMVTTQNAFWGGARYDRNIDRTNFGFLSYDFERDAPRGLNFRSVAGAGFGRHVVKNETTELDVIVGGAWNRTWQRGDNPDTPEGLAGATFKHRFHEKLRVQNNITFFQNVTDAAEYRFIFDSTLSVDVTKRVGVFITVGDRFNNDPLGVSKRNDFLFTTGMKWNFGKKH